MLINKSNLWLIARVVNIKHKCLMLTMTGPNGNSEFCFCMNLNLHRGTLRLRGYKTHCFSWSQSLSVLLVILPNSKIENTGKNRLLDTSWHKKWSHFHCAGPDHK